MEYLAVIIVVALVFGVCFFVDKGFTKLFRSQAQHKSGKAVRLSRHYGYVGLILAVLGLAGIFSGLTNGWLLIAGGALVLLVGIALVVYYMTFGIFYDADTFLLTTFGKASEVYRYEQITGQQLYNNQGSILIELYLSDGRSFQLQGGMSGIYDFMDHAFAAWLRQTGTKPEDCSFHDPANSCWFPPVR